MINWDVLVGYICRDQTAIENLIRPTRTVTDTFTTDFIMARAVDQLVAQKKTTEAQALATVFLGSNKKNDSQLTGKVRTLPVGEDYEIARQLFLEHFLDSPLDLTDWTTIAVMIHHEIGGIITRDERFTKLAMLEDSRIPKLTIIYETQHKEPDSSPASDRKRNKPALIIGTLFTLLFAYFVLFRPSLNFWIPLSLLAAAVLFILDYVEPTLAERFLEAVGGMFRRESKTSG